MNMLASLTVLETLVLVASYFRGKVIIEPYTPSFMENEVVAFSVTCQVPLLRPNTRYHTMYIERNGVRLGEATAGFTPVLRQNMTGAYIYGDVSKSITINMTQATCRDGGEYTCILTYTSPGDTLKEDRFSEELRISVHPGKKVVMTVYPMKEEYCLNDIVQLSCRGLIGENRYFSRIKWIWEYMDNLQNSSWINYTATKIMNDPPVFVNTNCQNRQDSYIMRNLTLAENNRTYRCYLKWDGSFHTGNPPSYTFTVNNMEPGKKVVMAVSPKQEEYCLNEIVQLSCSGLIGQTRHFSRIKWMWEYMDNLQNSSWINYTATKINNDPPHFVNTNCHNSQNSYIRRALTLEDNNRTYRCYLIWDGRVNTGNPPSYTFYVNDILPGQITLTAFPQYTYYEPETILEMNCSGKVGGTTVGTQIRWVWEYQDYQSSTWNSYMTESDIAPPTPSLPNNSCQNKQVSVLTRNLTLEDSRRTYRCYIHRNGQSYVEFAGMYQIGPIGSIDQNPSNNTDTKQILSTDTGTTTGVAWWIIVVAVAGGALLCLVIGTAVFLKRRGQRKDQISENKQSPNEEESKDDEEISDVPPSNALPMKSYPLLNSMLKKISGLGTDKESSVDPSEGASSRSSVSSHGTLKNA